MQHIFLQIIDSYLYFPQMFSDFSSGQKLHLETKQKSFFLWIEFLVRSLRETPKSFVLFPSAAFAMFITQTLWLWSRIGGRVKISHYIQPSNIYIALKRKFRFIFFPWTHFSVLLNCIRPNDVDSSYPLFLRCQVAPKALKGHYPGLERDIRPWANAVKSFITTL